MWLAGKAWGAQDAIQREDPPLARQLLEMPSPSKCLEEASRDLILGDTLMGCKFVVENNQTSLL